MTSNNKPFSVFQAVFPIWVFIVCVVSILFFLFKDILGVYSTLLGSTFSLIGLQQMALNQQAILLKNNKRQVFTGFLIRLMIYSVPITLGLAFPNYFKFWVILVCLFKSQIIFIFREFIMNYRQYKKRMRNG
jgi:hypothetical protein